ncbi:helix-turn-helix domain-containing protein [Polaribacter cellanae]|uniref:AraC family transcriptional regulator n=1 Tax=Polaribacter cellanae TaxID=2818493 RepID=A0A975CRI4_9FLAO|nr:helix-turn-helix domain-containing protein [Polaribacter cellanae]QTE23559.1 AraC family transcriptional regulator [Polaribacter cellanae]
MENFTEQLIYFSFFQSIFLLIIYLFSPKKRKKLNSYVIVFVFVLLLGLSGKIIYISKVFGENFRFLTISEFAILLFGSTVYLFTKTSLSEKDFSYKNLIHYIPGVLYSLFVVYYFMLPSDTIIVDRIKSGELYKTVNILVALGLSVNIMYWLFSIKEFIKFKKKLNNEISYVVKTRFFLNFLMAIGICLFSWLTIYISSFLDLNIDEKKIRQFIWLAISFIILFIAYYSMVTPDLFILKSLKFKTKYNQSKLKSEDLEILKEKLKHIMLSKKPYLNRKLLKTELAEIMGISNPELARLLNEKIGMNFFEFVNYYRIKEFIQLSETEEAKNLTFFGLAQEAGFNSKTTFHKSFKNIMGTSPSKYFNT